MARGVNKVILIGSVGKDPELRYLSGGDAVVNFSMATNEEWKDKATGEKKERAEWHKIVAYKGLAEIIGKYVTKGSRIYIEGKLTTRKWQDSSGQDRYTTEIIANEMQMLGGGNQDPKSAPPQQPAPQSGFDDFEDSDIPF